MSKRRAWETAPSSIRCSGQKAGKASVAVRQTALSLVHDSRFIRPDSLPHSKTPRLRAGCRAVDEDTVAFRPNPAHRDPYESLEFTRSTLEPCGPPAITGRTRCVTSYSRGRASRPWRRGARLPVRPSILAIFSVLIMVFSAFGIARASGPGPPTYPPGITGASTPYYPYLVSPSLFPSPESAISATSNQTLYLPQLGATGHRDQPALHSRIRVYRGQFTPAELHDELRGLRRDLRPFHRSEHPAGRSGTSRAAEPHAPPQLVDPLQYWGIFGEEQLLLVSTGGRRRRFVGCRGDHLRVDVVSLPVERRERSELPGRASEVSPAPTSVSLSTPTDLWPRPR